MKIIQTDWFREVIFINTAEILMSLFNAFWVGGLICAVCQIFIDKTKVTPARILVTLVVLGVFLTAIGIYEPLVDYAGGGATVPLMGFGYTIAKGVEDAVKEQGAMGILSGGAAACAAGISAAVVFGYLFSLVSRSSEKK